MKDIGSFKSAVKDKKTGGVKMEKEPIVEPLIYSPILDELEADIQARATKNKEEKIKVSSDLVKQMNYLYMEINNDRVKKLRG